MNEIERRDRRVRRVRFVSAYSASSAFLLAVLFLALHLPYLPASLEDLDSINFALGIRDFDVAHHQPHPPGYPVFILIAKAVHAAVPSEAKALALVSVGGAALGVIALALLFKRLDEAGTSLPWRTAPVVVAMTAPLYWFTAARPLSDSSGLAAALAVQAMTLAADSTRAVVAAAFCAGLAAGLRSQVASLTVPLLIVRGLGAGRWELVVGTRQRAVDTTQLAVGTKQLAPSAKLLVPIFAAFLSGVLVWFLPLVVLTGGPAAYWHALFDQGAEDLGNIQMLWTRHGPRDVVDALYYALVAPWAAWPIAAAALIAASCGLMRMARHQRLALTVLAVAFGPYLLFDLLFQETFTSRYALPLVVPMAYLAVNGARLLPWDLGLAFVVAIAMVSAHVGGTSIAAFSRAKAPAFRMLDDMREAALSSAQPPVLAPDRRESLDLRRPMAWAAAAPTQSAIHKTQFSTILTAPPQHEWLQAVNYWNSGGGSPLWFVVDPMRTSIDLVQHGAPVRYRWTLPYPVLLSGVRPNEIDWYLVDRPEWYVGEGWALTPESAGVAEADRQDLSRGPIDGWIARSSPGGRLMIGGRNFDPARPASLSLLIDGRPFAEDVSPGPFLRFISVPDDLGQRGYAKVTVRAGAGSRVAIEQFDASAKRTLIGYGQGWHEPEFNPRIGVRWRWLSERGEIVVRRPTPPRADTSPRAAALSLHLEGESPQRYFSRGSRLVVRAGDRVVFDETLSSDFSRDIPLGDAASPLVFETDQTYVPAEKSRRTQDRRRLGLRIFKCEIREAP